MKRLLNILNDIEQFFWYDYERGIHRREKEILVYNDIKITLFFDNDTSRLFLKIKERKYTPYASGIYLTTRCGKLTFCKMKYGIYKKYITNEVLNNIRFKYEELIISEI